mmetsp:Transcript_42300/g.54451  ORF Transcript_42300/g.54451 Transcript_42300/m.54451 type:complete len:169 (+) Transcript_42300:43-549(+)
MLLSFNKKKENATQLKPKQKFEINIIPGERKCDVCKINERYIDFLSLLSNTNLGFFICKKCKLHFENEIYRSLREHDQVLKRISMTILPLKVNIKRRNGNLELWTVDRNKDFLYLVENDLRIRVLSSVDDLVKFVSLKDLSILNENQFTLDRMLEISKQVPHEYHESI